MQTSKIKIGDLYAINTPNHGVVRFKVTQITTRTERTFKKVGTTNMITGIVEPGDIPGNEEARTFNVAPEAVLDSYEAYAELKAKQAEEIRIREETAKAELIMRERLIAKLYEITGIPVPEPDTAYGRHNHPFSTPYGQMVQIQGRATIERLLEVLIALRETEHIAVERLSR